MNGSAQALAMKHATRVLSECRTDVHSTILPLDTLHKVASNHGVSITILATKEYKEYTSLVYEIN